MGPEKKKYTLDDLLGQLTDANLMFGHVLEEYDRDETEHEWVEIDEAHTKIKKAITLLEPIWKIRYER